MKINGILLCAGTSSRMGFDKLLVPVAGKNAIRRSMEALTAGGVTSVTFVTNEVTREYIESLECAVPSVIVTGGDTRHDSVKNGLSAVPCDIAVIHDAARCFVTPKIVKDCISSAEKNGSGIAAIPVVDTLFRKNENFFSLVERDSLYRMQTPQVFRYDEILKAYDLDAPNATDDCTLYQMAGYTPTFCMGSEDNFKLTYPEDFSRATRMLTCYGTGFDTHRLVEGRKLILGGVEIPYEKGLLGHSDADVLTHAIMDALLGAGGLPDIGHLFPDTDPAYEGADSIELLKAVVGRLAEKQLYPRQVSAEIIAQKPKMAPHLDSMKARLSEAMGISPEDVSLAATTTEGMNDEGKGLCISARAIASLK